MHTNNSYRTLRRLLGQLGLLLPAVLYVANGFELRSSISHFYYTQAGTIFTGVLITFGLFLFTYRGYDRDPEKNEWFSDNQLTNIAGLFAITAALIPTAFGKKLTDCVHVLCHNNECFNYIHLGSASIFLAIMGGVAYFKFTLGSDKGWKYRFYKAAGIIVWVSLVAMGLYIYMYENNLILFEYGVYLGETVALIAFGSAWLIKGKVDEMLIMRIF